MAGGAIVLIAGAVVGAILAADARRGVLSPTSTTATSTNITTWLQMDCYTNDPVTLSQTFLVTILVVVISIKFWQYQSKPGNGEEGNDGSSSSSRQENCQDEASSTTTTPVTATITTTSTATSTTTGSTICPEYKKNQSVRQLQWKFLSVFWLLRVAFWMPGPYFYAAFASKTVNGKPMPVRIISQVSLTGYGAIALLGPLAAKITQRSGKRVATIVGILFYGLGSFSVTSNSLAVLFLGRAFSGVGQSIISNAPESWFVSEAKQKDRDPKGIFVGETFGLAYSLDSVVAMAAGQLAQLAAAKQGGPTGPFFYSPIFLVAGAVVVMLVWSESIPVTEAKQASSSTTSTSENADSKTTTNKKVDHSFMETLRVIFADPKIVCLGIAQSTFEAAMYTFVIAWAPIMTETIHASFDKSVDTPFGMVFSCFMAACMLGSTLFSFFMYHTNIRLELAVSCLMAAASLSLASSLMTKSISTPAAFFQLFLSYLGFETCVGIYFPSIGTLRAKILPDAHRSMIMTIFAVPLNCMIVTVFSFLDRLGHRGGVAVAAAALGLATLAMVVLDRLQQQEEEEERIRKLQTRDQFRKLVHKALLLQSACGADPSAQPHPLLRVGGSGHVYKTRDGGCDHKRSRSSFGVDFPNPF